MTMTMEMRAERLRDALFAWEMFIARYSRVEPDTAFDLTGDPPQFIVNLRQQVSAAAGW